MAAVSDRTFWKSLQSRTFERAYCLYGDDDFLKEDALRQLIAAAVDPATRAFNLDVCRGGDLDAETFGSLIGTPPMMAERRVVAVRDAAALRKPTRAVLDAHLAHATRTGGAADVVIVLVFASGEKGKPDKVLVERTCAVELAPLSGDRVPKWIAHHVATELGTSITPGAVDLLQHAVGHDLSALAAELDKLASYASGAEIDEEAVSAVVGVRRGETLGDFLDLVARRDAAGALALLPHVLDQPKTSAVTVVMALTTQTLALAWGDALSARGTPASRLEGEFFGLLKSAGGPYTGRPWAEAVRAWSAVLTEGSGEGGRRRGRWDAASSDAALDALLSADIALKETRVSSEAQLLESLVLALCVSAASAPRGAPLASVPA